MPAGTTSRLRAAELVYFGRDRDGVLESEFAGNLVEVCPTGVFTDKTLKRHYTRKWDLQAPSVCVHCGLGCNTTPASATECCGGREPLQRRGQRLLPLRPRPLRLRVRQQRAARAAAVAARAEPSTPEAAHGRLRDWCRAAMIGIGSPRASLESNFALRALVGPDRFYAGIPASESRLLR